MHVPESRIGRFPQIHVAMPRSHDRVRKTVMLHEIDDRVISKLLVADDSTVICASLVGIWHRLKKAPTDAPWYYQWRQATVFHLDDNYCFHGALNDDSRLCQDCIAYLATTSSDSRHFKHSDISLAVCGLTREQRSCLIDRIEPNARHATPLLIAIVGDLTDSYDILLKNKRLEKLWTVPLRRKPDTVWAAFARLAIRNGIADQAIVDETRRVLSGFGPIPEKFHREIEAWMSIVHVVDGPVRRIVQAGLREARKELEYWSRWQQERDL